MIEEAGRMVRKGGLRVVGAVEILAEAAVWAMSFMLPPRPRVVQGASDAGKAAPAAPEVAAMGSPLDNVGPIPEELRRDPFSGGSVPWCIEEAEKEKDRAREIMILKATIAVSWLVAAVALLRSFGPL